MSEQREWFEIDYSKSYTRDNHRGEVVEFDGFLIPAPSELLSRTEWEATIDYEAATVALLDLGSYHMTDAERAQSIVDAAIEEDS